jgi:hypothetical protein
MGNEQARGAMLLFLHNDNADNEFPTITLQPFYRLNA